MKNRISHISDVMRLVKKGELFSPDTLTPEGEALNAFIVERVKHLDYAPGSAEAIYAEDVLATKPRMTAPQFFINSAGLILHFAKLYEQSRSHDE